MLSEHTISVSQDSSGGHNLGSILARPNLSWDARPGVSDCWRNGKPIKCCNQHADQLDELIDRRKLRENFRLTIESYLGRTSQKQGVAILADSNIQDVLLSDNRQQYEINLPQRRDLLALGHSADQLSHALNRAWNGLSLVLRPFWETGVRSMESWCQELAAITLATYGSFSKISGRTIEKLCDLFGKEVIFDPETHAIRRTISSKGANNWFDHADDLGSVFTNAGVDRDQVIALRA